MEPRIQYAKTEDGVNIAYTTWGEGTPLVRAARVLTSQFQAELQSPENQRWYDSLNHKRVYYDGRNTGLSSKSEDYSLDAHLRDLDTVVDAIGLDRFSLYGSRRSGPIAVKYAATHPNRVSHLILFCASPDGAGFFDRRYDMMTELARNDWELFALTFAQEAYAWEGGQGAKELARRLQEMSTAEEFIALLEAVRAFDATPFLERVKCPTLVLHRKGVRAPSQESAQLLAARIPDAHLVLLEGESSVPFVGDLDSLARAINEFLDDNREATPSERSGTRYSSAAGGFATILFTDMESSTALTQSLGDAPAQEVRRAHNGIVRSALAENSGSEIKHTGDGIMASFASASAALDCAIAIQRGVAAHKQEHSDSPLRVYVGLNAGEPIAEDDDLFGTSVDLAARLVDHAQPGQIIASDVVRQLAAGKEFLFSDLGDTELRGFEDPVKLWEVSWREEA